VAPVLDDETPGRGEHGAEEALERLVREALGRAGEHGGEHRALARGVGGRDPAARLRAADLERETRARLERCDEPRVQAVHPRAEARHVGREGSPRRHGGAMVPSGPVSPARSVPAPLPRVRSPEVLAPAGEETALRAALAAGADAVYFGLAEGFNARARAGNFPAEGLADTVARIHRAGARAYLALNTLVFEGELEAAEAAVRRAAESGVDALIVQDPAVAVIARALCPALEVHASTQMTVSSAEGARFAASLGVTRVVVPRELSVEEIRRLAGETDLGLEVFVHGALCVAWSGQCFSSATWSGRSANRGECAQSCRMPYGLVVDGALQDLGDVAYLLSPKDLAGVRAVEDLAAIGVEGLKIEGRQKAAPYVFTATATYRRLVDSVARGLAPEDETQARADLLRASLAYTRGFSDGFLGGSDHQTLVEGRFPKHRGLLLGRVAAVLGDAVRVEPDEGARPWTGGLAADTPRSAPRGEPSAALRGFGGSSCASDGPKPLPLEPRAGMGVVFDAGRPEDPEEPGGPVFAVDPLPGGAWRLRFGTPGPDLSRVAVGHRVWVTSDPAVANAAARAVEGREPEGRIALGLRACGREGSPLRVEARAGPAVAEASTASRLAAARGAGLGESLLLEKLASLGGTPFRLESLDLAGLAPGLHVPVSELKALRRTLVEALLRDVERGPPREVAAGSALEGLRSAARTAAFSNAPSTDEPHQVPLCRRDEHLEAAIDLGLPEVELDWMEMSGLERAVARARRAGLSVTVATVRVQKPGEEGYDRRLAALDPDGVLVRHWGALVHFAERGRVAGRPRLHGDFSLNVSNSLTAGELFARGLDTLTVSHDLDAAGADALLAASNARRFTVVLRHRIPTFHTEHCVYSHLLSEGRDHRTCGRPCERHEVSLRDAAGRDHPVIVDVGCRNTVFNAEVRTDLARVPALVRQGVRRFRVELVRETREEARAVLLACHDALRAPLQRPARAR
jgi:putative protease